MPTDREIHQFLENIEKYLMVAQLENEKVKNNGGKGSAKLRSYLQNISKECLEARKVSLSGGPKKGKTVLQTEPEVQQYVPEPVTEPIPIPKKTATRKAPLSKRYKTKSQAQIINAFQDELIHQ